MQFLEIRFGPSKILFKKRNTKELQPNWECKDGKGVFAPSQSESAIKETVASQQNLHDVFTFPSADRKI